MHYSRNSCGCYCGHLLSGLPRSIGCVGNGAGNAGCKSNRNTRQRILPTCDALSTDADTCYFINNFGNNSSLGGDRNLLLLLQTAQDTLDKDSGRFFFVFFCSVFFQTRFSFTSLVFHLCAGEHRALN